MSRILNIEEQAIDVSILACNVIMWTSKLLVHAGARTERQFFFSSLKKCMRSLNEKNQADSVRSASLASGSAWSASFAVGQEHFQISFAHIA